MAKLDANRTNSDHCLRLHANVIPCPHAGCEEKFGLLSCLKRHLGKRHQEQGGVEPSPKRRWEDARTSLRKEQPDLERVFTGILEAKSAHMLKGLIEECVSESSMIRGGQQNTCSTGGGSSGIQLPPASPLRPGPSAHNTSLPGPAQPTASANAWDGQGIEVGNTELGNAVGVPIQPGQSNLDQRSPASAGARNGQDIEMVDTDSDQDRVQQDFPNFESSPPEPCPNILHAGTEFDLSGIEQPTAEPEPDCEFDREFGDLSSHLGLAHFHYLLDTSQAHRRAIQQHPEFMLALYRCIYENRDVFSEGDWKNRFK